LGAREIKGRLEKSKVGIFCMTAENLVAPWLLFEAGAISKSEDAHVCTLLVGLKPSDVAPPLGTFQHTLPEKADIHRLVQTINRRVTEAGEKGLEDRILDRAFEIYWPELEVMLTGIAGRVEPRAAKRRSSEEILDEVLGAVRGIEQRLDRLEKAQQESAARPLFAGPGLFNPNLGAGSPTLGGIAGILSPIPDDGRPRRHVLEKALAELAKTEKPKDGESKE
jgi:hypothetical protein